MPSTTRRRVLAGLAGTATGLAGCLGVPSNEIVAPDGEWPLGRHDPARTGHAPDVSTPGQPGSRWRLDLDARTLGRPVVALGRRYGEEQWLFPVEARVTAPPAAAGRTAYAPDWGGRVHALDTSTGDRQWCHTLRVGGNRTTLAAGVAVAGDRAVVGSLSGRAGVLPSTPRPGRSSGPGRRSRSPAGRWSPEGGSSSGCTAWSRASTSRPASAGGRPRCHADGR